METWRIRKKNHRRNRYSARFNYNLCQYRRYYCHNFDSCSSSRENYSSLIEFTWITLNNTPGGSCLPTHPGLSNDQAICRIPKLIRKSTNSPTILDWKAQLSKTFNLDRLITLSHSTSRDVTWTEGEETATMNRFTSPVWGTPDTMENAGNLPNSRHPLNTFFCAAVNH